MILSFNYNLTILFGDQLNLILDYPKHACPWYDHGSPNHIQALIKQWSLQCFEHKRPNYPAESYGYHEAFGTN